MPSIIHGAVMASESTGSAIPVVLLVEDNPADVRLAQEVLRESGLEHELLIARDGEQALKILRPDGQPAARLPDLVLLDLNIPRIDGREVLRVIKSTELLRRVPVLILSTSQAEADVLACYDLHANAYLTKPVDLEEFTTLARLLREFWFRLVQLPPRRVRLA